MGSDRSGEEALLPSCEHPEARARAALRLGDYQAAAAAAHLAREDGGDSSAARLWDFCFTLAAVDRHPGIGRIAHLHTLGPAVDTLIFAHGVPHDPFPLESLTSTGPHRTWEDVVASLPPEISIIFTRVLATTAEPQRLLALAITSRSSDAVVIACDLPGGEAIASGAESWSGWLARDVDLSPECVGIEGTNPSLWRDGTRVVGVCYRGSVPANPSQVSEGDPMSSQASADEQVHELSVVRSLHSISADRWLAQPARAYWCEWNHWGETTRRLDAIVGQLESENWPRFIKPGSVVVDIGGHSGDTAIPMGLFAFDKTTRNRGKIVVAEPNPEVLPVLRLNLELNHHVADFRVMPVAVTPNDIDSIELSDHGNAGCNGGILENEGYSEDLRNKLKAASERRYFARGLSMESLLSEAGVSDLESVSFVKTDCEGFDKEILRGATEFLGRYKPNLFVEWFAWFSPDDDRDFLAAVNEVGYVALDPVSLSTLPSGVKKPDVLCVHRDRLASYSLSL